MERTLIFSSYTLKQLAREKEELDKVYRLAESLENQKRDEEKTKKLQEMVREKGFAIVFSFHIHWWNLPWLRFDLDTLQNEIQNEKALASELESKLREWEKKIRQKQTEIGGANAAVTFNANVRKQERVLENRLETVKKRLAFILFFIFDRIFSRWNGSILFWRRTVYCVRKSIISVLNDNVMKIYFSNPKKNYEVFAIN